MRFLISLIALTFNFAKLSLGLLVALYRQQAINIFTTEVVGAGMKPIKIRVFKAGNRPLANADLWFHYLKGNFNLVGPKALEADVASKLSKREKLRFKVAPGLITPFQVRKSSGIAHEDEKSVSANFALNATSRRRLQILLAAATQKAMGNSSKQLATPKALTLFGVQIANVSMKDAIEGIVGGLAFNKEVGNTKKIAFVNADCVNKYVVDSEYQNTLSECNQVFADGIGMRIAARRHKARLVDNVNGTDMFPLLCDQLSKANKKIFLYGSKPQVVAATAKRLKQEYPGAEIAGCVDGYTNLNDQEICQQINESNADILFVALGAPKQEQWIADNAHRMNVGAAIGVGGLFDFYSGHVSRAPMWVRELSLEWVWRLAMQPKDKAKRYLVGNPLFLARVFFSKSNTDQFSNVLEVS